MPGGFSIHPLTSGDKEQGAIKHGHHHHDQDHHHGHSHSHASDHEHDTERRTISVIQSLTEKNERLAERNRNFFKSKGLYALNLLSSPGAGKTTLVEKTITAFTESGHCPIAVIVGDLETALDAERIRDKGASVIQVTTGTTCHLDAHMVEHGLDVLDLDDKTILLIENVGNLVCPAAFDLGESDRVVLLSTTEGEDKPLKYPPMFQSATLVIINKMDIAEAVGFDRDLAIRNIQAVAPQATIIELSARTDEGMDAWLEFVQNNANK